MYNPNFEFYYQVLSAIRGKHFVRNKKPPEKVEKTRIFSHNNKDKQMQFLIFLKY
jgi:hypothetical protein